MTKSAPTITISTSAIAKKRLDIVGGGNESVDLYLIYSKDKRYLCSFCANAKNPNLHLRPRLRCISHKFPSGRNDSVEFKNIW